jgi:ABC-type sugar transport system ATPase subunit
MTSECGELAMRPDVPQTAVLEVRGITKRFGGVAALAGASLTLPGSSVIALAGENGAGKSTLIKVLSGVIRPDGGEILLDGRTVSFSNPSDATSGGIATVYQELSLLPQLSVAENLFLGDYPRRRGFIDWRKARREAEAFLGRLGVRIPGQAQVADLSLAERYLVEIAKAVRHNPRILILDEPTAALDPEDSERIFLLMEELARSGTSMIFVSHRLDELFRCAQHYMVLKDGLTAAQGEMADTSADDLVAKMLGYSSAAARAETANGSVTVPAQHRAAARSGPAADSEPALRVTGLATDVLRGISFSARKGEIVGIAGLRGSGQTELCRAIVGADHLVTGRMELAGRRFAPRSPYHAWTQGVGFLPQDRKSQGLFLNLTVAQNVSMPKLVNGEFKWIRRRAEYELAGQYRDRLRLRLPGGWLGTPVGQLSGGNQQKVVMARCLAAGLSVLVMDEPTRGVDVSAKKQIHELVAGLAGAGLCVIVSSSELEELLALSAHVIVLHRGEMTAELSGTDLNEHVVVRFASGASG